MQPKGWSSNRLIVVGVALMIGGCCLICGGPGALLRGASSGSFLPSSSSSSDYGWDSGGSSSSGESSNERKTERGRLKFVISATSIHSNTRSIYRSVHSSFYVDGKEWSPEGDKDFAEKFESCDTSPNKNVEILRCFSGFGETPKATYILRMKNDKPEIKKIEAGNECTWIDDDGRWSFPG